MALRTATARLASARIAAADEEKEEEEEGESAAQASAKGLREERKPGKTKSARGLRREGEDMQRSTVCIALSATGKSAHCKNEHDNCAPPTTA
jgi:hypothetical protein